MAVKIQLRRGTQAQFNSASLDPLDGEVFLVQVNDSDDTGGYLVVGDGTRSWETLRDDVDARVYFEPGYSQTVMGGEQPAGSTPLTVKGATSQTAAILKVTNKGDNSILEIYDDEGPTVRLEDHGDVGEVFVQLKQQENQTANALELHDHGDNDQLTISCDGEVAITPTNNQTADAPSLDVKGSAATQSNGILRVKDGSNNAVLTVKSDGVDSEQTVTVDGGSIIAQVEDTAASNVTITASATDSDKVVTVDGNSGTENLSITAGGAIATNGAVTSEGKGTFADAEIDVTGRTTNAASVLRKDEIEAISLTKLANFTFACTGASNSGLQSNDQSSRLIRLSGSDGDNARKLNVFDPENVGANFTLVAPTGTSTDPETQTSDDVVNPYFVKVPANSGTVFAQLNLVSLEGDITYRILSYTSADGTTGKSTIFEEDLVGSSAGDSVTRTVAIPNNSVDLFIAVNHDLRNNSGTDTVSVISTGPLGGASSPLLTFFRGDSGRNFTLGSESSLP